MRHRRLVRLRYCFIFLLLPTLGMPIGKEAVCCEFSANKKPLWTTVVDLPGDGPGERCGPRIYLGPRGKIAYIGPQTIVAGFHVEYCFRPGEGWGHHSVDLILKIDAQTGKTLDRVEWKDVSLQNNLADEIDVLPTHDGQFLVKVGRFLKLFSPEFKEIRSRVLITDAIRQLEYWVVQVTPGGKTGFFKRGISHEASENHWFWTDTLEDQLVEVGAPGEDRLSPASAAAVYFNPPDAPSRGPNSLAYVREHGQQQSRPLCPDCYGYPVSMISNDMLFLDAGTRASFTLVSTRGEIIHHASFGDPLDRPESVTASTAPRFAFSFGHVQITPFSWKSKGGVVVFDTKEMKAVFELKFTQEIEKSTGIGSVPPVALAPDGTVIAVLSGRVLKAFEIPLLKSKP